MTDLVSNWTPQGALSHLRITFGRAAREWPELMEPWVVMLAEIPEPEEETRIMREGLRSTIKQRWPMPEGGLIDGIVVGRT